MCTIEIVIDGMNIAKSRASDVPNVASDPVAACMEIINFFIPYADVIKIFGARNWCDSSPGLRELRDKGVLYSAPGGIDDDFILSYADRKGGFIVSNDRFLDHHHLFDADWIKYHRIPYAWLPEFTAHTSALLRLDEYKHMNAPPQFGPNLARTKIISEKMGTDSVLYSTPIYSQHEQEQHYQHQHQQQQQQRHQYSHPQSQFYQQEMQPPLPTYGTQRYQPSNYYQAEGMTSNPSPPLPAGPAPLKFRENLRCVPFPPPYPPPSAPPPLSPRVATSLDSVTRDCSDCSEYQDGVNSNGSSERCSCSDCPFLSHKNPPLHFLALDEGYCCSLCRISKGRRHGGHCQQIVASSEGTSSYGQADSQAGRSSVGGGYGDGSEDRHGINHQDELSKKSRSLSDATPSTPSGSVHQDSTSLAQDAIQSLDEHENSHSRRKKLTRKERADYKRLKQKHSYELFVPGTYVKVDQLTRASKLNDSVVKIIDFSTENGRYKVMFANGFQGEIDSLNLIEITHDGTTSKNSSSRQPVVTRQEDENGSIKICSTCSNVEYIESINELLIYCALKQHPCNMFFFTNNTVYFRYLFGHFNENHFKMMSSKQLKALEVLTQATLDSYSTTYQHLEVSNLMQEYLQKSSKAGEKVKRSKGQSRFSSSCRTCSKLMRDVQLMNVLTNGGKYNTKLLKQFKAYKKKVMLNSRKGEGS